MEMKKSRKIILTVVGIIVALYTLFPFYLVVMNTFKSANSIVSSPVGFEGISFSQLMTNLSSVVNNSNFNFWYAFGTSVVITVVSLIVMVHSNLYGVYRIYDHSIPGCYASVDLYIP